MDRRKFSSMLTSAAGVGVTLTALQKIAPQAQAIEVRRDRQYVFRLPQRMTCESLAHMSEALRAEGIKAVVIDWDVDIFEVNG